MNDLIFKPIIPMSTMLPFTIVLILIVLINRKHIISRILIVLLFLIITQRPMLKDQEDVVYMLNLDVVFVVDTTVSMNAIDVENGTRLDEVKKICNNIVEEYPGSKFSIISFDNDAYMKYPFTDDIAVVNDVINNLKIIEPNYAVGSSLSLPAEYLKMLLESSDSKKELHDEKRQKIVFFFGDGELNSYEKFTTNLEDYNGLNELIDNGAVIGVGKTTGAKIRIDETIKRKNLVDNEGFLLDNSKSPATAAISKLNEQNLRELAIKLGIGYINYDSSELSQKIEEIKNIVIQDENDDDAKNDKDLYYYFSLALLVLMLLELLYYRRNEL